MSVEPSIVGISMMSANILVKNATPRDHGLGAWRGREKRSPRAGEGESVVVVLDLVLGIDHVVVVS